MRNIHAQTCNSSTWYLVQKGDMVERHSSAESHNRFVEIKDIVDKISEGESTHYIPVVLHV
jgi:hypothetical protein